MAPARPLQVTGAEVERQARRDLAKAETRRPAVTTGADANVEQVIVTQYKANPSCFYFFVYNDFVPDYNYFDSMNSGFGNEIHQLNPDNGNFSGKTYIYSSMLDKMFEPYAITPVVESPTFLFEIR